MNIMVAKFLVGSILLTALSGCTIFQRLTYIYSNAALKPNVHRYQDGGESIYYEFTVGGGSAETFIFFYGGSGCASWKSVLPGYVEGLSVPAKVFVLNKRYVSDRSTGLFGCTRDFYQYNNLGQWVSDYSDFIWSQINESGYKPKNIVLVGVSEGALPAVRVAAKLPIVTHLAIISSGGYTMRTSLKTLYKKGDVFFDVDAGWREIAANPNSIDDFWYGNTYRWWSQIMDYDPMPYFLALDIPILLGVGEDDESVPVESAYYLKTELQKVGKKNLKLKVYPMADHRLNNGNVSYRKEFFSILGSML